MTPWCASRGRINKRRLTRPPVRRRRRTVAGTGDSLCAPLLCSISYARCCFAGNGFPKGPKGSREAPKGGRGRIASCCHGPGAAKCPSSGAPAMVNGVSCVASPRITTLDETTMIYCGQMKWCTLECSTIHASLQPTSTSTRDNDDDHGRTCSLRWSFRPVQRTASAVARGAGHQQRKDHSLAG
jgi:hypothetical protein